MTRRYLVDFDLARLPAVRGADVLIVGSGIAGLYTALKAKQHGRVVVLTKKRLEDSNTEYAQGGIAAAIGPEDSPHLHLADTIAAGDGLCDPEAVRVLVQEGPECVLELAALGTRFDAGDEGFQLTREAAHSRRRILHARDATGEEIRRALERQVRNDPAIEVREDHFTVDVLVAGGRAAGVLVLTPAGELQAYFAPVVVLATGGAGQLYQNSTNPEVATGDGIAMAYRAGAAVQDIEFVQFHPTALCRPGSPKFLISEAVRGEGAVLLNARGERFMPGYHPRAELAPRDVVARAIAREMERTGAACVFLDATAFAPGEFARRFPTIARGCLERGVDPEREPIPVAPAAHYMMGGIKTDLHGRTDIAGLFACGETACTGIHGANRLASNSLLEGLVFGRRIAAEAGRFLAQEGGRGIRPEALPAEAPADQMAKPAGPVDVASAWAEVQAIMWRWAGINRHAAGLEQALHRLRQIGGAVPHAGGGIDRAELELANLATVAALVARAAYDRQESRGSHYRTDFPQHDESRPPYHLIYRAGQPAARKGANCDA